MEPLKDDELNELLRRWDAPDVPDGVEQRIFVESSGRRWYQWLLSGSIRVPVPVAALLLLVLWSAWTFLIPARRSNTTPMAGELKFSDFQPVKELKLRVIRSKYEGN